MKDACQILSEESRLELAPVSANSAGRRRGLRRHG